MCVQGVYFVGPADRYENVVGRQFSVFFEIVDRSPRGKDQADAKSGNLYQVYVVASVEFLARAINNVPGLGNPYISTTGLLGRVNRPHMEQERRTR